MAKIKNLAVSGITNLEQFNHLCKIVGDYPALYWKPTNPIVFYGTISNSYNDWVPQDYDHCTLYTYEDFLYNFETNRQGLTQKELDELQNQESLWKRKNGSSVS